MLNMQQSNKMGFSFIEILIVLLIVGLITSFVIPSFFNKQLHSEKKKFVAQFNAIVQETLIQATVTNSIRQIFFDLKEHLIIVKAHNPTSTELNEHHKFKPIALESFTESIPISPHLVIRNFFINGTDDIQGGNDKDKIWFYIMPDGTSQSIIINIEDIDTTSTQNKFALTVNPFYSQVRDYDEFQKP